jgi:hypothetical protein
MSRVRLGSPILVRVEVFDPLIEKDTTDLEGGDRAVS